MRMWVQFLAWLRGLRIWRFCGCDEGWQAGGGDSQCIPSGVKEHLILLLSLEYVHFQYLLYCMYSNASLFFNFFAF